MMWALVAVIVCLLLERAYSHRTVESERRRLINAILANGNPGAAALLERAAMKPSPVKRRPLSDPDEGDPADYVLIT